MSTNYYWRHNECGCCERFDELHIGKVSGGWEFMFQGYTSSPANPAEDIRSWDDWKARILDRGAVINEYGERLTAEAFIELVEVHTAPGATIRMSPAKTRTLLNHIDAILADPKYESSWPEMRDTNRNWKDNRGYAFSVGEFS